LRKKSCHPEFLTAFLKEPPSANRIAGAKQKEAENVKTKNQIILTSAVFLAALAVSVHYATADGTATNGIKYTAVSNTLAFGIGETNKSIVVPILDEGFVESTKSFRVLLSNPTGGALLGTRTNVPVNITAAPISAGRSSKDSSAPITIT
jgi:hypothetical protein